MQTDETSEQWGIHVGDSAPQRHAVREGSRNVQLACQVP